MFTRKTVKKKEKKQEKKSHIILPLKPQAAIFVYLFILCAAGADG